MRRPALVAAAAIVALTILRFLYLAATAPTPDARANAAMRPDEDPKQQDLQIDAAIPVAIPDGEAQLYPKAAYRVAAKLCGRKSYWADWSAKLAPYDACLEWGRLATEDLHGKVKFSQGNRWYQYRVAPDSPIDAGYVARHSANTHLILTDKRLRAAVSRLKEGDLVEFTGYLVQLRGKYKGGDIWWNSSLTRDDTGAGSCELLDVLSVRRGDDVWGKPLEVE
jgi:hypothetical protein